jgi:formate hydrogenlyase subunit 4
MAQTFVHILVVAVLPPLLLGVIGKTKAVFAGRVGAPVLQPYYDLIKLWQKGSLFSGTTTWVFRAGPVVAVATAGVAALLVPLGSEAAPVSFMGDFILFAYLLGLARFFTAAAALDTGSSFEGMGAAREVTFACLAEPVLFFGFLVLAKLSGALSLSAMLGGPPTLASPNLGGGFGWGSSGASLILVLVSWFILLLAENARIPFDDPNTHLELTMIHEVMVLDHGGPALGMIHYGVALKLFLFAALIVQLVMPFSLGHAWWNAGVFVVGMLLLAVLVGVVESVMARLRLVHVPRLLVAAGVLSAFSFVLLLR